MGILLFCVKTVLKSKPSIIVPPVMAKFPCTLVMRQFLHLFHRRNKHACQIISNMYPLPHADGIEELENNLKRLCYGSFTFTFLGQNCLSRLSKPPQVHLFSRVGFFGAVLKLMMMRRRMMVMMMMMTIKNPDWILRNIL